MSYKLFGHTSDGAPVGEFFLKNGKMSASILTYGGIIHTLCVDGTDVIGGYDTLADYESDTSSYQGALIGRVANRIGGGKFTLNGKTYDLYKNNGNNTLHGGLVGYNRKVWTAEEADDEHITLSLLSPDGDENFPGNLFVKVTYTLSEDALLIAYNAVSDADTPISLTNHAYFNLGGLASGDVLDYTLTLSADRVTEVDDALIPTGNRFAVDGTPFDFRAPHKIGERLDGKLTGYDNNFLIAGAPVKEVAGIDLPHVATLTGAGKTLEVYTDRPCIQIYTANFLSGKPDFKGGVEKQKRHAICLETQTEPDAINLCGTYLKAGEMFHTVTVYRFV